MLYTASVPDTLTCDRCSTAAYHVHQEDMSGEAHYALWYCMALIGGEGSRAARAFQKGVAKASAAGESEADQKAALQKGLKELLEKGLMSAERSGEGELVPKVLHLERLAEAQAFALA